MRMHGDFRDSEAVGVVWMGVDGEQGAGCMHLGNKLCVDFSRTSSARPRIWGDKRGRPRVSVDRQAPACWGMGPWRGQPAAAGPCACMTMFEIEKRWVWWGWVDGWGRQRRDCFR